MRSQLLYVSKLSGVSKVKIFKIKLIEKIAPAHEGFEESF